MENYALFVAEIIAYDFEHTPMPDKFRYNILRCH